MSSIRRIPSLAKAGILTLAVVAPLAMAGHLNKLLTASLDGRREVNASGNNTIVGDPDGRGEFDVFSIDNTATNPISVNTAVLCYNLQVKRVGELEMAPGNGRAAHIHKGKAGSNGPVLANLAWPQDGQAADCVDAVSQQARFNNVGVDAAKAVIANILANPDAYCVNVHNAEYPAGAIRGQLRVAEF